MTKENANEKGNEENSEKPRRKPQGRKNPGAKRRPQANKTPRKRNPRQGKKDDLFDYQPTGSAQLPPPKAFVESFVPKALEAIHGLREVRQITRWVNPSVYEAIEIRAKGVKLRRQMKKEAEARPTFTLGSVVTSEPRDGVCEAAAIVRGPTRVRAVALRLEGLDDKWKATSFRLL